MNTQHIFTPTYRITTRQHQCISTGEIFYRSIIVLKDVNGDIVELENDVLIVSNEYSFFYTKPKRRFSNFSRYLDDY